MAVEIVYNSSQPIKPFDETLRWAIEIKDRVQKISIDNPTFILLITGGVIIVCFMIWLILVLVGSNKGRLRRRAVNESISSDASDEGEYSDEDYAPEDEEIINHMSNASAVRPVQVASPPTIPIVAVPVPPSQTAVAKDRPRVDVRRVVSPAAIKINTGKKQ